MDLKKATSGNASAANRADKRRAVENNDMANSSVDERCPMCGAIRAGEFTDQADIPGAETIRRLAIFMQDDWRACCTFLLSVAPPHHPAGIKSRHIILNADTIYKARQSAAARFPDLSETLGLK